MKRNLRKSLRVMVTLVLCLLLCTGSVISSAMAASKQTTKSMLFSVWYEGIIYYITVYNYYTVYYTTTTDKNNITPQDLGGTIKNANRPAYYPFGQTIIQAYSKLYRGSTYLNTFSFSWVNPDPGLYDPNNKPYQYKYTPLVSISRYNSHEFRPFIVWFGNGTIPYSKTLQTSSVWF